MQRKNRRRGALLGALVLGLGGHATAAAAQQPVQPALEAERTIRVSGVGEVEARPDVAEVSFAVETFAATAREAGRENAQRMDRVIAALVAAGVPRDDIETRNYSVYPEYVHEEGAREPRIRGYRASNQMVLESRRLETVGELIDVALGAGANRMDGVGFRLSDPAAVQAEALREAVARARASAEAIAGALGVRLGEVLDASTSADPVRPVFYAKAQAERMDVASAPPPTPIQPGEQTVQAYVSLVFAIGGQ